jgi:hypothetical protein
MSSTLSRFIPRPIWKLRVPLTLLVASFVLTMILVDSPAFWGFMSQLPKSFSTGLIGVLHLLLTPVQPLEVHAQEEQLEFFTAWCFSGVGMFVLYLCFLVLKAAVHARNQSTH